MKKQMKVILGACVAVIALLVAIGGAMPTANAVVIEEKEIPPYQIDPSARGSITVHKHTTPAKETRGNGLQEEPLEGAKPVEGVTFQIFKVEGIDLRTNEGWRAAADLAEKFNQNPSLDSLAFSEEDEDFDRPWVDPEFPHEEKATNGSGEAVFSDLHSGDLYLVVESDKSKAKVDGKPTPVVGSKPFLVSVPMTHPTDRDKWNYDIHVYPKNAPVSVEKSVSDSEVYTVGSAVTFPVTTEVPANTGSDLDTYVIGDKYPADRLEFVRVDSVSLGEESLTADTHYTIDTATSGLVKVKFNAEGLKKLNEARRAGSDRKSVTTSFVFKVKAVGESDGKITNKAFLVPSSEFAEDPDNPGEGKEVPPSDEVTEHFAKIVLTKKDKGSEMKLAGAEFQLFTCESETKLGDEALAINDKTTFTTGENGIATIDGVRVSDHYNGGVQEASNVKYCLVETKAPEGYELLAEPILVEVKDAEVVNGAFPVTVENVKHNGGFNLPLTGSYAAILLGVAGALLVIGGVVMTVRKRTHS